MLRSTRCARTAGPTDGAEELYDMEADPGQLTNLAKQPEHADLLAKLRQQLDQRVKASGDGAAKKKKAKE